MTQHQPNAPVDYSPFPTPESPETDATTGAVPLAAPQTRPAQPPKRRLSFLSKTGSTIGMISAIVSLVGGIAALLFLFWPSLRPNEGPSAMSATLSNPRIETGVTYGEYWDRRKDRILAKNPKSTVPTADERKYQGVVVTFQVVIEGYLDQPNLVRWTMIDAATGGRLDDHPELADQSGWPDKYIVPTANRDQVNAEIWVSVPADPGPYALVIDVIDPNDVPLASLQTDSFAGSPNMLPTPTSEPTPPLTSNGNGGGAFPTLAPIGSNET